jgi:glycosyltransferase involved in cell wall biosynthesis
MKVLQVVFSYPPDPPGGTELYVDALCRDLAPLGVTSVVVAPGRRNQHYTHKGIAVRRFAVQDWVGDLAELYGDGDPRARQAFEDLLDRESPALVHQHALTPACSVQLTRSAKARGLPVVFTYHTPAVSCQRGTLLEWGKRACDGRVSVDRCTPCALGALGLGRSASRILANTPSAVGRALGRAGLAGGPWTALRMPALMHRRVENLGTLFSLVDRFVSLTPWVRALLQTNGVPDLKIVDSPHGVFAALALRADSLRPPGDAVRIAHLGRLEPVKGTRLLIEAVRGIPGATIELDVFGILQGHADVDHLQELRALAGGDGRIRLRPAIEHAGFADILAAYDAVAVPSQAVETGPLVVLEALAAGVPVIGSALGGIAERIRDEWNGILVRPFNSLAAWRAALARCAAEPHRLTRLRPHVRRPRLMRDVAREMATMYGQLVQAGASSEERHAG